ncbi:hypothetical protein ABC766_00030 [Methylobacterium fujisawaense]|jgi:hypothetical protein|uniref:hypothetical protein n=1 Tax=Methylobacterium fujisawaense TaxID=107400 RepID=UPI0031F563FF
MLNVANLDKLIAHLEAQPPEKFNMRAFFSEGAHSTWSGRGIEIIHECGTAACIAGWIMVLHPEALSDSDLAAEWLGLSGGRGCLLFEPPGYSEDGRYPLSRAIATLKRLRDRFLATGEIVIDWGPEPSDEPAQPWAAPQATELTQPALPAEITRLLEPAKVEA